MDSPLVSVVIASHTQRRIRDVFELLEGTRRQTYSGLEVILVAEQERDIRNQVEAYVNTWDWPRVQIHLNDSQPDLSANQNLGITAVKVLVRERFHGTGRRHPEGGAK